MKFISCMLVLPLLVHCGCYTTGVISRDGLRSSEHQTDITVFTRDSLQYNFSKENYHVQGDTLSGYGVRTRHEVADVVFQVSFSLSDIDSIATSEFDATTTILVAGGIGLVAVGIVALLNRQNRTATVVFVTPVMGASPVTSP